MKRIILISTLTLVVDILTKQLVINTLIEHQSITIIKDFFSITYAKNTGVAFSFLEGNVPLIIILTSIIIFFLFSYLKTTNPNKYEIICYGLLLGGSLGNLIDRVVYGYVIDFLDFNLFGYPYPIFNIADIAIVVSIFTIIILSLIESRNKNEINSK